VRGPLRRGIGPAARDRAALFRLHGDGWYVQRIGNGEILLNHEPVRKPVRLRSGDIVRMSESGPDFSFTIVTRTGAALPWAAQPAAPVPAPAAPAYLAQSPAPAADSFVMPPGAEAALPPVPAALASVLPEEAVMLAPSPAAVTLAPSPPAAPAALPAAAPGTGWSILYIVAGVAICAGCFVLAKFLPARRRLRNRD